VDLAPGTDAEAPAKAGCASSGACSGEFVFRYKALEAMPHAPHAADAALAQ
jgi:hypothetical protein